MPNNTQDVQAPQSTTINANDVPEALVFSILSDVTLIFEGFDTQVSKFRLWYIDQNTQEKVEEIITLTEATIPNPDYDNNLPTSDTNQPTIQQYSYVLTQAWLNDFYNNAFNGTSANLNLEIFHLNAALLQVIDHTIFIGFKDQPIVTPIQGLIPLPFNAPFADIGIRGAVPQETPEGTDELSWNKGYTEPYQRPTNREGKWIKMGQFNQIIYDISKSALTLQDNLSILAGYINDELDIKIDEVKDKLQEVLDTPPANAVLLTGNQNVAGLKNFTGVNINNFKNSPSAVANLEWCSGLPIKSYYYLEYSFADNTNYTITQKNVLGVLAPRSAVAVYLNNKKAANVTGVYRITSQFSLLLSNKDTFKKTSESNLANSYFIYGN